MVCSLVGTGALVWVEQADWQKDVTDGVGQLTDR